MKPKMKKLPFPDEKVFVVSVRWMAAAVLFAAAALKAMQLASVPSLSPQFMYHPWVQTTLIEFELFLGIFLICNVYEPWAARAACCAFGIFAIISMTKILTGASSCGCFGAVEIAPEKMFILDLGAAVSLGVFGAQFRSPAWKNIPSIERRPRKWRLFVAALLAIVVSGVPAWAIRAQFQLRVHGSKAADNVRIIEVADMVNKELPFSDQIEISDDLTSGTWILVLYRQGCSLCEEAIPQYVEVMKTHAGKYAFIEIPSGAVGMRPPDSPAYLQGKLSDEFNWYGESPIVVKLKEGVVVEGKQGEDALSPKWLYSANADRD